MEARIIGPASELGNFESLDFFGNSLTREFSKIEANAEQLRKLEGNRFVELRGKASKAKSADSDQAAGQSDDEIEEELIRARLTELGTEVSDKAKLPALRTALDKAEKAKAAQDAEEAEVLADRIRDEQAQ